MKLLCLLAGVLALFAGSACALTITNLSAADCGLIEVAPTNSNGGQLFFNAGTTQNNTRNRGLVRFNLGSIPTNAVILSAAVVLTVVQLPAEQPAESPFSLHRVFRNWGEGTNVAVQNIGQGRPARPGDATWTHAQFSTNAWTTPGGAPGVDFRLFESSSVTINTAGFYTFSSTPDLAADVQSWLHNPAGNFGWLLSCDNEGTPFTARRFAAREDSDYGPQLVLNYLIPPRLDLAALSGDNFLLGFRAEGGQSYTVEYRNDLSSGVWQTLVSLGAFNEPTRVLVVNPITQPNQFYRVNAY